MNGVVNETAQIIKSQMLVGELNEITLSDRLWTY